MLPDGVLIAQVVKQYARRRVAAVVRRVARGAADAVQARLAVTQGRAEAVINTGYGERLNGTFRGHLAGLVRRTPPAARPVGTVEAGMGVGGTCYNFCWPHDSLRRRRGPADPPGGKWVERTPAQAAGLTEHRWSVQELLTYQVPSLPLKRRGRRPRWLREVAYAA